MLPMFKPQLKSLPIMKIVDNKAVIVTTRKGAQITALIPKSKVLESRDGIDKVLVHWDLDEMYLLRNMGIKDVPSPILGRYGWPGMFTPFEHQRTTAEFLTLHPRCYVFNEAGTGKTSAAAWAADYLMKQGKVKRVLVVCPVSIMETAWRSDLFKTTLTASDNSSPTWMRTKVSCRKSDQPLISFSL